MTLQERMKEAFPPPQPRGLQAHIARVCEVKGATVSAWFNKPDKVSGLSRKHAEILCRTFDLSFSPQWLAEGSGPKLELNKSEPHRTGVIEIAKTPSMAEAVRALALYLEGADEKQRSTAAVLLTSLASRPETADAVAKGLQAILEVHPA